MGKIKQSGVERAMAAAERAKLTANINTLKGKIIAEPDRVKKAKLNADLMQLKYQRQQLGD